MNPRPLRLPDGRLLLREDGLPLLMGILNVTPDSFSDGGEFDELESALTQAEAMHATGADIIDIGAESTRPGAAPVNPDEEWRRLERIVPAVAELGAVVSIDTYRAATARRAIDAGAAIINDVSAARDPEMFSLAAKHMCPLVLMHMLGDPKDMQDAPRYDDVVSEVFNFLLQRVKEGEEAGVSAEVLCVDPGFGFGKTLEHNLALVRELYRFRQLGPVLLGLSRKSSLAALTETNDGVRLPESLAGVICGAFAGADIVRVHDVEATRRALTVAAAMHPRGD